MSSTLASSGRSIECARLRRPPRRRLALHQRSRHLRRRADEVLAAVRWRATDGRRLGPRGRREARASSRHPRPALAAPLDEEGEACRVRGAVAEPPPSPAASTTFTSRRPAAASRRRARLRGRRWHLGGGARRPRRRRVAHLPRPRPRRGAQLGRPRQPPRRCDQQPGGARAEGATVGALPPFLRENWAAALYHDRFAEFREALRLDSPRTTTSRSSTPTRRRRRRIRRAAAAVVWRRPSSSRRSPRRSVRSFASVSSTTSAPTRTCSTCTSCRRARS